MTEPMAAVSGYAAIEGARLYYERAGEGFPVVLIHGSLWDARMWDEQFATFAEHHDVVRYDIRGYGRSDVPTRPYSDLRDLLFLLGELDIGRCALVGCALGAQLAVDFAIAYPDLVEALVAVAPGLSGHTWKDPGLEMLVAAVDEAVRAGDLEGAMEIELAVWAPLRTDPAVDARIREIAMGNVRIFRIDDDLNEAPPPAGTHLSEITAATLVVVGDGDIGEIDDIADVLVKGIPGAQKRVIADADHAVCMRRPEKFNQIVLDFLSFRR